MTNIHISEKTAAFLRAIGVAILFSLLTAVSHNIGASGLVSSSTAAIIVGIIGVIENAMSKGNSKALFGSVVVE